uniref:C2 domain-containing protein n=1 Tax=Chromera velia CCMP2878 TaxID=1169474 RepID=A0A0G4HVU4_9ALVE|mmetsp:Transcript_54547/g.106719  ORF Transcript_54547/g.106719 Transcript_54547/m.106719 type:complete len:642 (+) Transcript_54547:71-1996(+)|eukprot:Cvel_8893.t1-p1 / transcript=Cvel_8893.t1 / gene=Cvel_8893 / organism=Chromera_velia_CCMP2878 / gene_product=Metacaspase-1, putative / transcript_product=Metacaspase-1, putative / location=Cvel_scaffold500:53833-61757(-) / protein_length=641 / sequence_SO=supercontig / SO=protein_coding / is_pseudo=false
MGRLQVTVVSAHGLKAADLNGKADPYVKLFWRGKTYKTEKQKKTLTPSWNETWVLDWDDSGDNPQLVFEVWDWDRFTSHDLMGRLTMQLQNLNPSNPIEGAYPLNTQGQLVLRFVYIGPPQQAPPQQPQRPPMPMPQAPNYPAAPPSYEGSSSNYPPGTDEIHHAFPQYSKDRIADALRRCNGDRDAATTYLLEGYIPQQGSGRPSSSVRVDPNAVRELCQMLPQCTEDQVRRALQKANGDKERATAILINDLIMMAQQANSGSPQHHQANAAQQQQMWQQSGGGAYNSYQSSGAPAAPPLPQFHQGNVGAGAVRPSGRKKALFIGINYFGTRASLRGCINDTKSMKNLLCSLYGFADTQYTMVTLTDDQRDPRFVPTRQNMMTAIRWLTDGAQPGDVLFFHFSGHGAQQEDPTGQEEDGLNETILPVDFQRAGMITDDELNRCLVAPLPAGVRLTAIMDCCHSGTGLDLPFLLESYGGWRWTQDTGGVFLHADVMLISGCEDDDVSADAAGKFYSAPGGAMTTAFCAACTSNPYNQTYPQLMNNLHRNLRNRGFPQKPQLSSSQQFDINRPFAFDDIHPNMNQYIGRPPPQPGRRRRPKRKANAGLAGTPLGGMLGVGAAVAGGVIAGAILGDIMGDLLF